MDSIQEQIVKKVLATFAGITTADGYHNTIASVQRQDQDGPVLAVLPTILIQEGECEVELDKSPYPWTQRRLELYAIPIIQQDPNDARSGAEQLGSVRADIELAAMRNKKWGGLAENTLPPDYMEVTIQTNVPHLAEAMRFHIVYRHHRDNPYSQD